MVEKATEAKEDRNGENNDWCDLNDDGSETLYRDVLYMCASCSSTIYRIPEF